MILTSCDVKLMMMINAYAGRLMFMLMIMVVMMMMMMMMINADANVGRHLIMSIAHLCY